ncbi:MAG TPA: GNAT family N-acetyltransferase [Verrucomicrobiae bacterium]|nr:GNAT family N-acetyltransferase [Verrucomicrobiae bacterium]
MNEIEYSAERKITPAQFIDILSRSGLAERRPVSDRGRIATMLDHADLLCTAWADDNLVGVARSVTDFAYSCYLSDLAVDRAFQGTGIGTELIRLTQSQLHPKALIVLLSAPQAAEYYPKIGMTQHHSAWVAPASPPIPGSPP